MPSLRDIKRRIKSVKNTQQITKAMKMVSAAKLRRAQEDILSARPYADRMLALIRHLATRASSDSHPLLSRPGGERTEVVLMTSDRGLCGSFNVNLIRTTERFLKENPEQKKGLYLVGRKGFEYYKRRDVAITRSLNFGMARPSYEFAVRIARDIMADFLEGKLDEVYLIYSRFKSALSQEPVLQRILPIIMEQKEGEEEGEGGEYIYEPSEAGVLESLLPKYVEVQIFRALLETSASEHGARMTAMDNATRNASEMIDSLTLTFNRLRQAAITKELMEIIGGAEALKG